MYVRIRLSIIDFKKEGGGGGRGDGGRYLGVALVICNNMIHIHNT